MNRRWVAAAIGLLVLGITSAWVLAQMGPPPGPPPPFGMLLHGVTLTADQRAQAKAIVGAHRPAMESLHRQLDKQREGIIRELTSSGKVSASDLAPLEQQSALTEQRMHHEMLATALAIRGILTPHQLARMASNQQKLAHIHDEMRDLMGPPPPPPPCGPL